MIANWRIGRPSRGESVPLVSYVFLKDGPASDLDAVKNASICGDKRYGLGRVRRIEFVVADRVFSAQPLLDGGTPYVDSRSLFGHRTCAREMLGAKDSLTGWARTAATDRLVSIGSPRRASGSLVREDVKRAVDPDSNWTSDD